MPAVRDSAKYNSRAAEKKMTENKVKPRPTPGASKAAEKSKLTQKPIAKAKTKSTEKPTSKPTSKAKLVSAKTKFSYPKFAGKSKRH